MQRELEVLDQLVEIVGQRPYCTSKYFAQFPNFWNNTIMERLNNFGYKSMWSTWVHHNLSPTNDREMLQIVKRLQDR